jgi:hypothetical protein
MKLTVYKNQYGYSTLAKNKNTGDKMYISIHFTQGTEPNSERADIEIKDAFFSMYKNKAGFAFPKLVIMKYKLIEEENFVTNNEEIIPPNEFDDSDPLPF